jgi:hypothetical protein
MNHQKIFSAKKTQGLFKTTPSEVVKILLQYDDDFFLESADKPLLLKDVKCVINDSESNDELIESLLMVLEEYNPSFRDYSDEFRMSIKSL